MIFAIANQKGGVSKTTTTVNLGQALYEMGNKILLVDLDPQGSLTLSVGLEPAYLEQTVYDVLIGNADIRDVIDCTGDMHILPSNIDLSAAEAELLTEIGRESILGNKLKEVKSEYDYVLIDCPPSLGLLTINAMAACDGVIAPVSPDFLSLRGLVQLSNTINRVKVLNPHMGLVGVLITMLDQRTLHDRDAVEIIQSQYKTFNTAIKRAVAVKDSATAGQSILVYDPSHDVSDAYRELAKEVTTWAKDQT